MVNTTSIFVNSPLSGERALGNTDYVAQSALPFCLKLILRGQSSDQAFVSAVKTVTGLTLPDTPNSKVQLVDEKQSVQLLWLGPDEWLLRILPVRDCALGLDAAEWVAECQNALQGIHSAVVDVSDYYTMIRLEGPRTFDVLEKCTPLNVRQSLQMPEQCAQTRLANAQVLLSGNDLDSSVDLQVRSTFSAYVWQYLSDASLEFNQ